MHHPDDTALARQLVDARQRGDHTTLKRTAWALALHHEKGIRRVARPYRSWNAQDREDFHQQCLIVAHRALLRWDPERASALTHIGHALRDTAQQHHRTKQPVAMGRDPLRARQRIVRAVEDGHTDVDDIAAAAKVSPAWVRDLLPHLDVVSLDGPGGAEDTHLADTVAGDAEDPADVIVRWERLAQAHRVDEMRRRDRWERWCAEGVVEGAVFVQLHLDLGAAA